MGFPDRGGQHNEVLQNFADAILEGRPLLAPGAEGLRSVELANAMLFSTWSTEPSNCRSRHRLRGHAANEDRGNPDSQD